MEEVWHRGEASVRDVMQAVNAGAPKQRAYTSYMTVMSRLEAKGMLERTREGKTDFYRPLYIRSEYTELRARAEVDSIVDQFGEVALGDVAAAGAAGLCGGHQTPSHQPPSRRVSPTPRRERH